MIRCFLDFETRSAIDLKKVGAWTYSSHYTTQVICAAVKYDKYYEFNLFKDDHVRDFIKLLNHIVENNNLIYAHNAFFEYCVLNNIICKKHKIKPIHYSVFRCTSALALLNGLPKSLESACVAADTYFRKDIAGYKLMMKMCKPSSVKDNIIVWHEDEDDIKRLMQYCMADVLSTENLYKSINDFTDNELNVWIVDFKMNLNGIYIDIDLVDKSVEIVKQSGEFIKNRVLELTDGELKNINSPKQILDWVHSKFNINLKSLAKADVENYLESDEIPDLVKEVMSLRLMKSKSSVAKAVKFKCMESFNRIHGVFIYHGAFTGRWAGTDIQPQNLPRGISNYAEIISDIKNLEPDEFLKKHDSPLDKISGIIRGFISAPENKTLLVVDYKAIESRVILWLAGDEGSMDKFRKDTDLYIELASVIYDCKEDEVTKSQRSLGKTAILGLGYGMGVKRFIASCLTSGIEIDMSFAKSVVSKYRDKYQVVTNMWKLYENAFTNALNNKKYYSVGSVCFSPDSKDEKNIVMTLPSGRKIIYRDCKIRSKKYANGDSKTGLSFMTVNEKTKQYEIKFTWGGDLVQNATQAVARDLIAHAMVMADKAGFKIVMTVHDELVVEADSSGELEKLCEIMKSNPKWAEGLPLDVEGWSDTRYHK